MPESIIAVAWVPKATEPHRWGSVRVVVSGAPGAGDQSACVRRSVDPIRAYRGARRGAAGRPFGRFALVGGRNTQSRGQDAQRAAPTTYPHADPGRANDTGGVSVRRGNPRSSSDGGRCATVTQFRHADARCAPQTAEPVPSARDREAPTIRLHAANGSIVAPAERAERGAASRDSAAGRRDPAARRCDGATRRRVRAATGPVPPTIDLHAGDERADPRNGFAHPAAHHADAGGEQLAMPAAASHRLSDLSAAASV